MRLFFTENPKIMINDCLILEEMSSGFVLIRIYFEALSLFCKTKIKGYFRSMFVFVGIAEENLPSIVNYWLT